MSISIGDISSISGTLAFTDHGDGLGAEEIISAPVFGRSKEQKELLEVYQRVVETTNSTTEVVFVHGLSGSGKTILVDSTLREKVLTATTTCDDGQETTSSGYFCYGKFFQNSGSAVEPYSAIMTAFSDLCDLVTQSNDFDDNRRNKIRKELLKSPEEAALLGRMINLSPFNIELLPQSSLQLLAAQHRGADTAITRNDVTFAKLKSACTTFLHTMSSTQNDDHPTVLFIDDVQWMDEGSKQLILALMSYTKLKNVLFILAYRDEEADKVDCLLESGTNGNGREYTNIQLTNLDLSSVQEMVCGFLACKPTQDIVALTDLVTKRTQGNPFYVFQFLDTIVGENLLTKNEEEGSTWIFDVIEIQREVMAVSATLADLLHRKINHLSSDVKITLTVASLFGYSFHATTLFQVAAQVIEKLHAKKHKGKGGGYGNESHSTFSSSQETAQLCLTEAVKAGFIEELENGETFQFSHDKLYSAFLSLVHKKEEQQLHFLIGEAFIDRLDNAEDDSPAMTYNAAVHFNEALTFFPTQADRIKLARINLTASRHCQEMIAFDTAADLLQTGVGLLDPQTRWASDNALFDLTFEMTEELGRTELAAGRLESCKKTAADLVSRAKSIDMKTNGLWLGVECRMAANEAAESILAAKIALRELNVAKIPNKVSLRHLLPKLISVKRKMKRKTDNDILGLPLVQNRPIDLAVRLLSHVCVVSLLRDDDNQGVYAALLAIELTIKYGLTQYSSTGVAMLGAAEITLGNYDRAYRYGKLALQLLEVTKSREAECQTVGLATVLLLHWKEPLSELKDALGKAAYNGLERGDFVYGAFSFWQYTFLRTLLGTSLEIGAESLRIQYERASALGGNSVMRRWLEPSMQFMANLQSESTNWEELSNLTGEFMDASSYIADAQATNSKTMLFSAQWCQAQLACYFGQYELAEARYRKIQRVGSTATKAAFATVPWFWFGGIIHYERYRSTGRGSSLRKARRCKRSLERMTTDIGCPNSATAANMLEIKEISLSKYKKSEEELVLAFDKAIEGLGGISHFEAMANEDAGFALARLGSRERARKYFRRAMDIYYHDWGSFAKYQWVEEKSAEVLSIDDDDFCSPIHVGAVISFQGESCA